MTAALALTTGGALLGPVASPASAAAFDNGSFEDPVVDVGGNANVPGLIPSIPSWTVEGDVDIVTTDWAAADGAQSIDLNGFGPGFLCQEFDTTADRTYEVSYQMSRNGFGLQSADLVVTAEGSLSQETHDADWSPVETVETPGPNWEPHSIQFVAEGASSQVCFASLVAEGPYGPAIDDVRVSVVNAPPTATITTPSNGAIYYQGQNVTADYSCDDVDGNLLAPPDGCVGTVPDGDPVPTGVVGNHTFEVTATDSNEAQGFASTGYQVRAVADLCEATALQLLNASVGNANPPGVPCVSQAKPGVTVNSVIGIPMPNFLSFLNNTIQVRVVGSSTNDQPGVVSAESSVASAVINIPALKLKIELGAIHSISSATLADGCATATVGGLSRVATLRINGGNVVIAQGQSAIPLGIGTLHINQRIAGGGGIIHRGVFLDLAGTALDVVLAESQAAIGCIAPILPPTGEGLP